MRPILVDGEWRPADATGSFRAVDPTTGAELPDDYPVSTFADFEQALAAAARLVDEHPTIDPERLAGFLETLAGTLEARRDELVAMANRETALPAEPRLRSVELPRTTDQLRQAAAACRDRSWRRVTIDTARNIRSMYGPLGGPVVVLGPSNFPFAFNAVGGGDFAAAIATGNPVLAKANPGHPGTTRLLAEAAFESVEECGLPPALVQLVYHCERQDGLRLAGHPLTGALAFTGSRASGLALKDAADRAGTAAYLEMSSVNPVVVLPGALEERSDQLARELLASCTLGAGQFCTRPGLVLLLESEHGERFVASLIELFAAQAPGYLLGAETLRRLEETVVRLRAAGAELVTGGQRLQGPGFRFENTLLRVSGERFRKMASALQAEAFGSLALVVVCADPRELAAAVRALEGSLTGTICSHSGGLDDELYAAIEPALRRKVGRLLNDKMPTGVAVSPAMVHGGPFPATGHPGFTSVGIPASLLRFAALRCYDNVREERLPAELRDANPTGTMWRWIDGEWTQGSSEPVGRTRGG